jgi:hypothetical protein
MRRHLPQKRTGDSNLLATIAGDLAHRSLVSVISPRLEERSFFPTGEYQHDLLRRGLVLRTVRQRIPDLVDGEHLYPLVIPKVAFRHRPADGKIVRHFLDSGGAGRATSESNHVGKEVAHGSTIELYRSVVLGVIPRPIVDLRRVWRVEADVRDQIIGGE